MTKNWGLYHWYPLTKMWGNHFQFTFSYELWHSVQAFSACPGVRRINPKRIDPKGRCVKKVRCSVEPDPPCAPWPPGSGPSRGRKGMREPVKRSFSPSNMISPRAEDRREAGDRLAQRAIFCLCHSQSRIEDRFGLQCWIQACSTPAQEERAENCSGFTGTITVTVLQSHRPPGLSAVEALATQISLSSGL